MIELTFGDLRKLRTNLEEALRQSEPEYQRLMRALAEKDSTISPESIQAMLRRWIKENIEPGRTLLETAATASGNYQHEHAAAERCLEELGSDRPNKQAVLDAGAVVARLWQAIAGLAIVLNGSPLHLSYRKDFRGEDARAAVNARHEQPGGYREKEAQALAAWASGKYKSRNQCAAKIHESLGLTQEVVRRYLKGSPAPS